LLVYRRKIWSLGFQRLSLLLSVCLITLVLFPFLLSRFLNVSVLSNFDFEDPVFYKYLPQSIRRVIYLVNDMDGGTVTGMYLEEYAAGTEEVGRLESVNVKGVEKIREDQD
jgi:hypothetical protein